MVAGIFFHHLGDLVSALCPSPQFLMFPWSFSLPTPGSLPCTSSTLEVSFPDCAQVAPQRKEQYPVLSAPTPSKGTQKKKVEPETQSDCQFSIQQL